MHASGYIGRWGKSQSPQGFAPQDEFIQRFPMGARAVLGLSSLINEPMAENTPSPSMPTSNEAACTKAAIQNY